MKNNKKALYESIMRKVAKVVKKCINEGTPLSQRPYEPYKQQPLDIRFKNYKEDFEKYIKDNYLPSKEKYIEIVNYLNTNYLDNVIKIIDLYQTFIKDFPEQFHIQFDINPPKNYGMYIYNIDSEILYKTLKTKGFSAFQWPESIHYEFYEEDDDDKDSFTIDIRLPLKEEYKDKKYERCGKFGCVFDDEKYSNYHKKEYEIIEKTLKRNLDNPIICTVEEPEDNASFTIKYVFDKFNVNTFKKDIRIINNIFKKYFSGEIK